MAVCDFPDCGCKSHRQHCLSGDQAACQQLVRRFTPLIRRIVERTLGPELSGEWDDAVQEALLRILRRMNQWEEKCPFCKWLSVVAANSAINLKTSAIRDQRRSRPLPAVDRDDRGVALLGNNIRLCVEETYKTFPERLRDVYDLTFQGQERQEVAETLGVAPRTVQYALAEIRDRLQPCLDR